MRLVATLNLHLLLSHKLRGCAVTQTRADDTAARKNLAVLRCDPISSLSIWSLGQTLTKKNEKTERKPDCCW